PERLLGDAQYLQKVRHLQPRIALNEMHHAMMRAAKAEFLQHMIGIADKVAVGEKQQFDNVPADLRRRGTAARRLGSGGFQIYVSHIDIFWCYVTKQVPFAKLSEKSRRSTRGSRNYRAAGQSSD